MSQAYELNNITTLDTQVLTPVLPSRLEGVEDYEHIERNIPSIRSATLEDVDDLAKIELGAYLDVYGISPSQETVDAVRSKYEERVNLLAPGGLIKVLEHPDKGTYGMIVCCPTNLDAEDLMRDDAPDMTDNINIQKAYDPEGRNAYIVNMAVLPRSGGIHDSDLLFKSAVQMGNDRGTEKVYFESRMPRFDKWVMRERTKALNETGEVPSDEELANRYWKELRPNGQPLDPLLRHYVANGGKPLRLVRDAWRLDRSSQGYGVLFELNLESLNGGRERDEEAPSTSPELAPSLNAAIEVNGEQKGLDFWHKTLKWAQEHKIQAAVLTTSLGGLAYTMATGQESSIVHRIGENAPWIASAYATSLATYFTGGAMMAVAAGQRSLNRIFKRGGGDDEPAEINHNLLKAGYYVNAIGAVAAASVVGVGIVETLPPDMWATLAIPAVDLYSTLASRSVLAKAVINEKKLPDGQEVDLPAIE